MLSVEKILKNVLHKEESLAQKHGGTRWGREKPMMNKENDKHIGKYKSSLTV